MMKCENPRCNRDKSKRLLLTSEHPVFGAVCQQCYAEYQSQQKEVAAKVEKTRREYGRRARTNSEVKMEKRKKIIQSILGGMVRVNLKHKAPLVEMQKRLLKRGVDVSITTVKKDLKRMGWRCNNGRFKRMEVAR